MLLKFKGGQEGWQTQQLRMFAALASEDLWDLWFPTQPGQLNNWLSYGLRHINTYK